MSVELGESTPVTAEAVLLTGPEIGPETPGEVVVSEADVAIDSTASRLANQLQRLHDIEQDWQSRGIRVNARHF